MNTNEAQGFFGWNDYFYRLLHPILGSFEKTKNLKINSKLRLEKTQTILLNKDTDWLQKIERTLPFASLLTFYGVGLADLRTGINIRKIDTRFAYSEQKSSRPQKKNIPLSFDIDAELPKNTIKNDNYIEARVTCDLQKTKSFNLETSNSNYMFNLESNGFITIQILNPNQPIKYCQLQSSKEDDVETWRIIKAETIETNTNSCDEINTDLTEGFSLISLICKSLVEHYFSQPN